MGWFKKQKTNSHFSSRRNWGYLLFGVAIVGFFLFLQYRQSLFFTRRENITVGFFLEKPFVLSYSRQTGFVHLVSYDSQIMLNVSGGYGMYKLGSLNLLGRIEKKRSAILIKSFQELIGVPVDLVVYPKKALVLEDEKGSEEGFNDYFFRLRQKGLNRLGVAYSTHNIFDLYMLQRIVNTRVDKLILTNAANEYLESDGNKYYNPEKLDNRLKGFFYQPKLTASHGRVVILTTKAGYKAARRIARLIEGMGIKVQEINLLKASTNLKEECFIESHKVFGYEARLFADYFQCRSKNTDEKGVIYFRLGKLLVNDYN